MKLNSVKAEKAETGKFKLKNKGERIMFTLSYKTRGGAEPTGKQRVFFACHPDDFDRYFDEISDEILATQNCAIYYIGKTAEAEYDEALFLSYLSEMRLVVIPVTTNLLTRPSRALDVVYKFAQERHIPVLTLMQEDGLAELYTRTFGDLQYLDKHAKDDTAIPFEKKLSDYLSSVLVGDELAEKVRKSFDAYIFLSYRKKDRVHAQELMKLIHKNEFCRDIAIWYDEFLTPGEGFNGAIKAALEKSSLFALAVTPNLLEDGNYVMTKEYPMAKEAGKKMLPAEVVGTDRKELAEKYDGIPECTDAHDEPRMSESLLNALEGIAKRENDDDQDHNFMIGLAYLTGIDVEVDVDRALGLITGAANAGVEAAMKKLVDMYRSGDGVERDYLRAIEWQKKLVEECRKHYNKSKSEEDGLEFVNETSLLGKFLIERGKTAEAIKCFEIAYVVNEQIAAETLTELAQRNLYIILIGLGDIFESDEQYDNAYKCYEQSLDIIKKILEEKRAHVFYSDMAKSYEKLGDVLNDEKKYIDALEYYRKAHRIRTQLAEEHKTAESRRDLASSFCRLGRICIFVKEFENARVYIEKSIELYSRLANEELTSSASADLAAAYCDLGDLLYAQMKKDNALEYYMKSLKIKQEIAEETDTVAARRSLSKVYDIIGDIMTFRDLESSCEYYLKSLEIKDQIAEETKSEKDIESVEDTLQNLFKSYYRLGVRFLSPDNTETSFKYFIKALEMKKRIHKKKETVETRRDLIKIYDNLGYICIYEEKFADAHIYFDKAIETMKQICEKEPTEDMQKALSHMCESYGDKFRFLDKATESLEPLEYMRDHSDLFEYVRNYYERSLEIKKQLAAETKTVDARQDLCEMYEKLGRLYELMDKIEDSYKYYECSFEIKKQIADEVGTLEANKDLADICSELGHICVKIKKFDDARELIDKSLKIRCEIAKKSQTEESYFEYAKKLSYEADREYYEAEQEYEHQTYLIYLEKARDVWKYLVQNYPKQKKYLRELEHIESLIESENEMTKIEKADMLGDIIGMVLIGVILIILVCAIIFSPKHIDAIMSPSFKGVADVKDDEKINCSTTIDYEENVNESSTYNDMWCC